MTIKKNIPSLTILIPTINEGKILKRIIDDSRKESKKYNTTIMVVVCDKTTKETKKIAEASKAKIIDTKSNMGKGAAISLAIAHIKSDFTIQIDADYQFIPSEIPKFMNLLLNGYDVVLGTRYEKNSNVEKNSVTRFRLLGGYGLSYAASIAARKRITDVMAGYKGFKTEVLKELNPKVDHFGYEAELAIRASRKKYKVINLPISYKKRQEGRTTVSSIKHGFLVLITIINTGMEKV